MNTTCITKSWLNNKSQELGIAASAIESIVHEYINQQGNDNFPTDDYIKQQFVPKSSIIDDEDYFNNLIKIYDNIGGETIYNDEQEAIIAQNRALKSFPDESVILMPTNDGKYIVRIAKPNLLGRNKINIWAGTNENKDLSNVADRPFDLEIFEGEGKIHFNSVEQAFQYVKFRLLARNLGYEEATNKFLLSDQKLTGEDYKENVEHYVTPGTKAKSIKAGGHGIAIHNSEDYEEEIKLIKDHIDKILNAPNGFEAKKLGGKNGGYTITGNSGNTFLNTIWDYGEEVSQDVMKAAIKASFEQNPQALQKLLATGNATLTHTQDKGIWGEEFPRILMEVREELRNQQQPSQKEKGEKVSDKNTFKGKEEEEKMKKL